VRPETAKAAAVLLAADSGASDEDNALDKLFTRPGTKLSLTDFRTGTVLELHRLECTGGLTAKLFCSTQSTQCNSQMKTDRCGQNGLLCTNGDGTWLLCSDTAGG